MTQTQFRTMICNDISPLLACDSNLQIDMQAYTGYSGATFSSPTDANGNLKSTLNNYQPGTPCSVVLVRAFYTWKVLTPVLQQFLVNANGAYHLITATAAFRNEPYTNVISGC